MTKDLSLLTRPFSAAISLSDIKNDLSELPGIRFRKEFQILKTSSFMM